MRASQTPSRRRIAWGMMALLVALLLATQAMWACIPARAQGIDGSSYRFEGFIKAKSPDKWLIGTALDGYREVAVSPQTVVISKAGYAPEVGAWIIVFSRRSSATSQAYLIQIDRPAGAPGVPIQFTGSVMKKGDGWWKIGETPVAVTLDTRISDAAYIGSNVWVGATMDVAGLRAEWIRVLPLQQIVEFEGILREIGAGYWIIDDHQIAIMQDTIVIGEPQVGMFVECRALKHDDGTLMALELHVGPPSLPAKRTGTIIQIQREAGGAATWRVLLEQAEPGEYPAVASVHVDGNTWVDQTRAVAEAGQWFRLRGAPTGPNSYQADLLQVEHGAQTAGTSRNGESTPRDAGAAPWSTPTIVANRLDNAEHSMLAFTGDGAAHAIWETDNRIYSTHQGLDGMWSAPEEVAYGFAPYMIAERNGTLHVAFVNSFMGNFESYYVVRRAGTWSLPVNMSHTDGYSARPKLALAPDGVLHATWMDYTPGYWTTYHATWAAPFWSARPIPSGRGEAPSITVAQDGTVYTVWQDRVSRDGTALGDYEVFLAGLQDGTWTPPVNISDSHDIDTLGPDVTVTADGFAHVVWIEGDEHVRYSYGQDTSWSEPTTIATATGYANGVRIATESGKFLHVAWDEGYEVRATTAPERTQQWPESSVVADSDDTLRDVCLATNPSGGVGLSWAETYDAGQSSIFVRQREPMRDHRMWMPLLYWKHNE
jgi:hypothetical protein